MSLAELTEKIIPVVLAGLVFGAGLPAFYALGMRLLGGTTDYTADGRLIEIEKAPKFQRILAYIIFAIIILVIIVAILWIAKDFIYHTTGFSLFGLAGQ